MKIKKLGQKSEGVVQAGALCTRYSLRITRASEAELKDRTGKGEDRSLGSITRPSMYLARALCGRPDEEAKAQPWPVFPNTMVLVPTWGVVT